MRMRLRDPGIFLILDPRPRMEKIRIRDTQPGSATLHVFFFLLQRTVKAFYTMLTLSNCFEIFGMKRSIDFHHISRLFSRWTERYDAFNVKRGRTLYIEHG